MCTLTVQTIARSIIACIVVFHCSLVSRHSFVQRKNEKMKNKGSGANLLVTACDCEEDE